MNDPEHIHSFILEDYSIIGTQCWFGPGPCTHCGGCITGSGNHDFNPTEEDGKWIARYRCSICGETREVAQ